MTINVLTPTPRQRCRKQLLAWIQEGRFRVGEILPTERMLSKALGVSQSTVWRALSELEREGVVRLVAPQRRVVAAADAVAGAAAPAETFPAELWQDVVVVLTPEATWSGPQRGSGWFDSLVGGMLATLQQAGRRFFYHCDARRDRVLLDLVRHRPAGVLLPWTFLEKPPPAEEFAALRRAGIAAVAYGDEPELAEVDRVVSDHRQGTRDLTRLLLDRGCRNIVQLWSGLLDDYWVKWRRAGYEEALREAGAEIHPHCPLLTCPKADKNEPYQPWSLNRARARAYSIAGMLLERFEDRLDKIDGVECAIDSEAFLAGEAFRLLGRHPGEDVFLTGYDNYWNELPAEENAMAAVFARPTATVEKFNRRIGECMAELLLSRLSPTPPPPEAQRVILPQKVLDLSNPEILKPEDRP